MASITLPWVPRDTEKLSSYRETAIRWLVIIALAHIPIILGAWLLLDPLSTKPADLDDWKVLLIPPLCLGSIGGLLLFAGAAFAVYAYEFIGRILTAPWVAFIIFIGAIGGIILGVWLHAEILLFVQTKLTPAAESVTVPLIGLQYDHTVLSIYRSGIENLVIDLPLLGSISADTPIIGKFYVLLAYLMFPLQFPIVRDLVAVGGIIGFISLIPGFGIWWERKVAGRIQSRMGPMRAGGWHGWAQSAADGIKLAFKEDYVPPGGDGVLFRLAPYVTFIPPICAFIALPFATAWVFRDLDVALIFILAMLGIEVMGVILAGWASNNKWSVYGAMREACQMVSYEVPLGISLICGVLAAGTLNMVELGFLQGGGIQDWYIFHNPFLFAAFFTYFVASLASCKRAPFDLPESESELVSGFHTEYSGLRFSFFFFAEYAGMFVVGVVSAYLFLGGWNSPLGSNDLLYILIGYDPAISGEAYMDGTLANAYGWKEIAEGMGLSSVGLIILNLYSLFWVAFKAFCLVFIQIWLRWTLPRIRIDQVLYTCVKVLLPISLVLLIGTAVWVALVPQAEGPAVNGQVMHHWGHLVAEETPIIQQATQWLLTALGLVLIVAFFLVIFGAFLNRDKAPKKSFFDEEMPVTNDVAYNPGPATEEGEAQPA